jgi:hypothetical protein
MIKAGIFQYFPGKPLSKPLHCKTVLLQKVIKKRVLNLQLFSAFKEKSGSNEKHKAIYLYRYCKKACLTCVARAGLPAEQQTPRLSPQLAMMMYFSVIRAHTAVVPDLSSPLATFSQSINDDADTVSLLKESDKTEKL